MGTAVNQSKVIFIGWIYHIRMLLFHEREKKSDIVEVAKKYRNKLPFSQIATKWRKLRNLRQNVDICPKNQRECIASPFQPVSRNLDPILSLLLSKRTQNDIRYVHFT